MTINNTNMEDISIQFGNYLLKYSIEFTFIFKSNSMLKGKTILITGGGSGIGAALAQLLSENNKVVICGRTEDKLKKVASASNSISYYVADISVISEVDNLFNRIAGDKIRLDVIFNNAGVVERWDLTKTILSSQQIFEKINTNLSGPIAATQLFISQADRRVENFIVNVTSEIAFFPVPILPLYATSKAALSIFTKSLRQQLKGTNFKVIEILPPAIDTAMPKQLGNKGKLLNANIFASGIIECIDKGKTEYAPGDNVAILKLFNKFLPNIGLKLIDRMSRKQLNE